MRATAFELRNPVLATVLAYSGLGRLSHSCLSGPAGSPRENLSLIGTGLTGLLGNCSRHGSTSCIPAVVSWAPSIFIPENCPGLRLSLGG
jgi:hypothetical protein